MSYEGNFLSTARGATQSFHSVARSFVRFATAAERMATAMEKVAALAPPRIRPEEHCCGLVIGHPGPCEPPL